MYPGSFSRRRRSKFFPRIGGGSSSISISARSYLPTSVTSTPSSYQYRSSSSSSHANAGNFIKDGGGTSSCSIGPGNESGTPRCAVSRDIGVVDDIFQGSSSSSPSCDAVSTSAVFKIRSGVLVADGGVPEDLLERSKSPNVEAVLSLASNSSQLGNIAAGGNGESVVSLTEADEEDECEEAEREFFCSRRPIMTNDEQCSGFESQTWRRDRCKKCFRLKEQHNAASPGSTGAASGGGNGGVGSGAVSRRGLGNGNVASRLNKFLDKSGVGGVNSNSSLRASSSDTTDNESIQPRSTSDHPPRTFSKSYSDTKTVNGKTGPKLANAPNASNDELSTDSNSSFSTMSNVNRMPKGDESRAAVPSPPSFPSTSSATTNENSSAQKRKTKLVLIKAEVSYDGRPSEPVDLETTPTPVATECTGRLSTPSASWKTDTSKRTSSPQDGSLRSVASSSMESFHTAPSTVGGANMADDPLSRTVSFESVASTLMEAASMITAASGRSTSLSERSSTPTESLDTDTQSFMRSIKAQLEIMENKCAKLEDENAKLRKRDSPLTTVSASDSDFVKELKEKLALAESLCQDYRDENTVLKCELRDLQELTSRHGNYTEVKEWRNKLKAAESLCEELMEENETLKNDLHESRQEIDEMHDQYREEEIEEFRELQRELEQTAKNCRILQFKLRKSERRHDQTEADRQHLELKLKEFLANGGASAANAANLESPRLRELESELRIAKEVSVRLHNELESLEEKRCKLEDENFYLKEKVRELETREKLMEQMRARQELKRTGSNSSMGKGSHVSSGGGSGSNNQNGQSDANVMQLLRDMQDALERETDLREQLRFAEEDIQAARKKLADLETENEGLMRQLAKFTNTGAGGRGKPQMKRSFSEGHAQIELELAEHEATVLKDRLTRMEKDSERMVSQISLLETEVKKFGGRTEFMDDELRNAIPDTYYKQKIKMLEEEVEDLKKKLEDARRPESEQRLPQMAVSKMLRERDSMGDSSKNVDVQRQLSLVEQEVAVLRQRIADLEMDNDRLNSDNKRLVISSKKTARTEKSSSMSTASSVASQGATSGDLQGPQARSRIEQMEKDIHRFISRIAELEKEKDVLYREIERRKKLETIKKEAVAMPISTNKFNTQTATVDQLRSKVTELIKENSQLESNLKVEQEKMEELESQLSDYKQVINQSEDQKVVVMESKLEILANELREARNRIDMINYEKVTASSDIPVTKSAGERRYEDMLKERVEILERALGEEKARHKTAPILVKDGSTGSIDSGEKEMLAAELSSCHQMLSTVEDQVDRLYKQIEQLEQKQQVEKSSSIQPKVLPVAPRQTPSTLSSSAEREKVLKDIAIMKTELDSLRHKLHDRRTLPSSATVSKPPTDIKQLQAKCQQQETTIAELKNQLENANREKVSAQQHSETSTTRLLQTEERWNKELEKLKESYENQVKDLKYYLQEAERVKEEKTMTLEDRSTQLQEKTRRNQELESKVVKLEQELKTRHKDLQDRVEVEKKRAKEFETKYQKLEAMYEADRQKLNTEKEKVKMDLSEMKKRYEETQNDFEKLKQTYDRKDQIWQKEKQELQTQVKQLQSEMSEVEKKTAKKAAEMAGAENQKLLSEMSSLKRRVEADADQWKTERVILQQALEQKTKDLDFRLDELERMRKEMDTLKSRIIDQKQQLEEARRMREETRDELSRWQQTWARERSEMTHKLRQEEKVQQAEQQALQQKYDSRIKVMEDSARRIQAQLSQTRRERDNARDSLSAAEKRIVDMRQKYETDEKELRQRILGMEKEVQEAEDVKVQLEKERVESKAVSKNYETDKRLWNVEREQFLIKICELEKATGRCRTGTYGRSTGAGQRDEKDHALQEAIDIANELRTQLGDLKSSYDEEVMHLHKTIEGHRQEWSKERGEMQRKLKELQENMKILEIDRRNLISATEQNESDKTTVQTERDSLIEKLHDSEIHQLANKYKLDKVADQMGDIQSRIRYGELSPADRREINETLRRALEQLLAVRDDMAKTKELGKAFDSLDIPDDSASMISYRSSNGSRKMSVDIDSVERDAVSSDMHSISGRERLGPVGSDTESKLPPKAYTTLSKTASEYLKPGPVCTRSSSGDTERSLQISTPDKNRSVSGDIETRMAELRLRSPSPSPRKITNYPEPPPNMVLNIKTAVEYDSSGRRHWTRRSLLRRSTSFDPAAPMDISMDSSYEMDSSIENSNRLTVKPSHPRSASTGADGGGFLCHKTPLSQANSEGGESGSEMGSARSQSPLRRRFADIFATMRKNSSHGAKAKRGLFGAKKSASIETSDVGHRIGAMGVQVLSPAVTPGALPDSVRTSDTSLDDPPKQMSKSTSGSSIFARLRNRSSSRGALKRQGQSADEGATDRGLSTHQQTSSQDGGSSKSVPTTSSLPNKGTWTSSQAQKELSTMSRSTGSTGTSTTSKYRPPNQEQQTGLKIKDSLKNSRIQNTYAFRRLSSSYCSVRSASSKLHRL